MLEVNPPDKWQKCRKSGLKLILVSALITLSVPFSAGRASAISSADTNKITVIEKRLFFKSYAEEPLEKRLERLEKRFFGEPLSGEPEEQRLTKIFEAAGPQVDADGTVNQGHMTPDPTPQKPPEKSQQSKPPKSKNPGAEYPSSGPQDNEAAWEKASEAAIGARDEEIRTLMKDAIKLSKRKEFDGAADKFNQVIRLDPQNAEAFFSLGVIFESKGQLDQALTSYNQAADINPDRLDYKEAITALQEKGVKKQAVSAKQAEINQRAKEAADAFKRKEYMSALEMYKRLETDFPKNAPYKYNIGTIYLMMQNPVQALEYYEMARKLNPKEERYVAAATKLKDNLKADEQKRKEIDSQWDAKEKADRKSGKQTGGSKPGGKQTANQKPPKGGQPGRPTGNQMPPGFQQAQGSGNRPPVYQPPPQQPSGYPPMNTGYQQQQPGGYGGQQTYNPQQQMPPQGFNQQPGMSQPAGFNPQMQQRPPMQQGYANQNQQQQPSYGGQMQQPGYGNQMQQQPVYGNQMQQPGFVNPMQQQPNYGNQMQQPGFGTPMQQPNYGNQMQQPGYGNQMQQPNYGNQMQSPGYGGNQMQQPNFNQQGYPNQSQMQGQNQMAYAQGQTGVSGLQQPAGQAPNTQPRPPLPSLTNKQAPTGTGPDPLANLGILAQPSPEGVSVTTIGIGSRASKGKLNKGDIIMAVDGVNVTNIAQLKSVLQRKQPEESAQFIIKRKGKVTQVVI